MALGVVLVNCCMTGKIICLLQSHVELGLSRDALTPVSSYSVIHNKCMRKKGKLTVVLLVAFKLPLPLKLFNLGCL